MAWVGFCGFVRRECFGGDELVVLLVVLLVLYSWVYLDGHDGVSDATSAATTSQQRGWLYRCHMAVMPRLDARQGIIVCGCVVKVILCI